MNPRCPFGRGAWCIEPEPDPDDHVCRSTETELPSGWSVTRMHDDEQAAIYLADPDLLLPAALTGRLTVPDALDLIAALAQAAREAQDTPTTFTSHGSSA